MSSNTNVFEIRLKTNRRFTSRHYEAKTPEQAAQRIKDKGRILSIRKVHPADVIGTIESMHLQDIIGISVERRRDVILDGTTLDSIVFPKKGKRKNKHRRFKDEVD